MRLFLIVCFVGTLSLAVCCAEEIGHGDAAQLVKSGDDYFYSGAFDKAIEAYQNALLKTTDKSLEADIYFALSSVYLEKGVQPYLEKKDDTFYKKCLEYIGKCLAIKPQLWKAWANRATIYMNMGDYKQADNFFTEAEKYVEPNSPYRQQLMDQHSMVIGAIKLKEMKDKEKEKSADLP